MFCTTGSERSPPGGETAPTTDLALPAAPPGPTETAGRADAPPAFVERADRRPQTISPVLPDYPREAERRGIRARVRLRLRIDARGRLVEATITDRFLLDTGYDLTMIHPDLAQQLNLQRAGRTQIIGIAGREGATVYRGARFDFVRFDKARVETDRG